MSCFTSIPLLTLQILPLPPPATHWPCYPRTAPQDTTLQHPTHWPQGLFFSYLPSFLPWACSLSKICCAGSLLRSRLIASATLSPQFPYSFFFYSPTWGIPPIQPAFSLLTWGSQVLQEKCPQYFSAIRPSVFGCWWALFLLNSSSSLLPELIQFLQLTTPLSPSRWYHQVPQRKHESLQAHPHFIHPGLLPLVSGELGPP